jgi:hypothetical protein
VKRVVFVVLLCVACGGREERESSTTMPTNPPPVRTSSAAPTTSVPAPVLARRTSKSTPQKCAGDGSYEQALDCFQMSSGFHFALNGVKGEMKRPTPGMESVHFKAPDGAAWTGEAKHQGVVWSRNGKHELSPPDITNEVWQRTTMLLDPQKKEGAPQLVSVESVAGEEANHYHFTNANSGEANDVWVSTRDGRIVKWTKGKSVLELR